MTVRRSWLDTTILGSRRHLHLRGAPGERRLPREHSLKLDQRLAYGNVAVFKDELADGSLVGAASFLDNRQSLPDLPGVFKIAKEQNRVSQVAHINRRHHVAEKSMLSHGHDRSHPLLAEIGKHL